MVLEKGILALSASTRRPNERDLGRGINEIKGWKNGDVEVSGRSIILWTSSTSLMMGPPIAARTNMDCISD